eukprot:1150295-Pelagomonas_calceolata.AAC.4
MLNFQNSGSFAPDKTTKQVKNTGCSSTKGRGQAFAQSKRGWKAPLQAPTTIFRAPSDKPSPSRYPSIHPDKATNPSSSVSVPWLA